jgi:PAS domain S-box-containing protein
MQERPLVEGLMRTAVVCVRESDTVEGLDVEQFRALIDPARTMIWRAGADGGRNYFNAAWLAFTGRAVEREIGEGWTEGVHPIDLDHCIAVHRDHFEQRRPFETEFRLRRFDGVYRCTSERGAPYLDAAGAFGGFVGSCVDVDEPRASDTSTGAEDFFDMSLDNLCVAGFDGCFKRINPSWTTTLGWTSEELLSRPSIEFVHPDDRAETLARRQRLTVGAAMGPLINRYRCKDGTYRWFEWRSVAHADRGLVYASARDITEQKHAAERLAEANEIREKMQRQLVFADRMASVGTLAAGIAHEINNPLGTVVANVAMMLEVLEAAAAPSREQLTELREMAVDVAAGAERIRTIVRGLKTFSRPEQARPAVIDPRRVLELSIDMTINEIRHRARLVKDFGPIPLVDGDEARLGQVFVNLLVNAAQALPEGETAANEIRLVTSTDAAGRAVVEVRDTGAGIPAAIIDRVFDPFFTTKPVGVGTGLGLSICHNNVEAMGGEITVKSEEGRGTTFRVVLPAASAAVVEAVAPPVPRAAKACASVLVVDDEPAIGLVLRRVLREHEVKVVSTAKEALALLGAGAHFDVILSDLMMPEMTGMDFHEELTRHFPEVAARVVFVSGGAFTPAARAFLARVPNLRIDKPFDPASVRELIQRLVG